MFFSLNKKIFYIISIFFIIASIIFILSFYIVYGGKIQEDQRAVFRRNQQYLQLLSENTDYSLILLNIKLLLVKSKIQNAIGIFFFLVFIKFRKVLYTY